MLRDTCEVDNPNLNDRSLSYTVDRFADLYNCRSRGLTRVDGAQGLEQWTLLHVTGGRTIIVTKFAKRGLIHASNF